jgi:hypothetical protein
VPLKCSPRWFAGVGFGFKSPPSWKAPNSSRWQLTFAPAEALATCAFEPAAAMTVTYRVKNVRANQRRFFALWLTVKL